VTAYLDRLREMGVSERLVDGERDGWILMVARWPDRVREWMPYKVAYLEDPRVVRLYRVLSEMFDSDTVDDRLLVEAADIMAGLAEQAHSLGQTDPAGPEHEDLPYDLVHTLAVESDPRALRMLELMRERGWAGWSRAERLPDHPG
jgi:hypothetical protein